MPTIDTTPAWSRSQRQTLLGIAGPISVEPTGSGDTTAHYVQLLVIGVGAMIGAAAMANVVMLNFAYDVAVKSFSVHLLIVALVLVGLDGRRLLAVFVLDQAVPARAEPHVLGSLRARSSIPTPIASS